jgi:hypothetical protein
MIQIDVAELTGIICEGILFGVFFTLVSTTLWILAEKRGRGQRNLPFIIAAIIMLALALAQLVVDAVNVFRAFIPLDRTARILFLSNVTEPIFAAKHSIYFTMMLVGDAIVIFRAFVVWNRNYFVVILPTLCLLGSFLRTRLSGLSVTSHLLLSQVKLAGVWQFLHLVSLRILFLPVLLPGGYGLTSKLQAKALHQ